MRFRAFSAAPNAQSSISIHRTVVERFKAQEKRVNAVKSRIEQFLHQQATQLAEILASESPRYIRAVRKLTASPALTPVKSRSG